jgi:hypothetical protein
MESIARVWFVGCVNGGATGLGEFRETFFLKFALNLAAKKQTGTME